MKALISVLALWSLFVVGAKAQTNGVLINYIGATRDNSAVFETASNTQGILVPRLTEAQRDAIALPATSLLIYQTDNTPGYYYNSGTPGSPVWQRLSAGTGSTVSGTGAATRVAFWDGANSLSSNADLYWNNTDGRLGIGTTTPGAELEVVGQIKVTGGAPGLDKVLRSDGTGLATWEDPNTLVDGDNLGDHVATQNVELDDNWLNNDGTSGNGIRINNNGDVGINTANQYATFHVLGNAFINNAGFDNGFPGNPSLVVTAAASEDIVRFRDQGSNNKFVINHDGNVGIGTTAPSAKFSLTNSQEYQLIGAAASPGFRMMSTGLGHVAGNEAKVASIGFGAGLPLTNDSYASLGIKARRLTNGSTAATTAIGLTFDVYDTSPVNNAALWIRHDGNISIGTWEGTTPLHVRGSQIAAFTGATRGIMSIEGDYTNGYHAALDFLYTNGANPTARIAAQSNSFGSKLMFGTSNSYATGITNTAMTIDHEGNVGIGTTGPTAKLDVDGKVRGLATYAADASGVTGTTTLTSPGGFTGADLSATIAVQNEDLVKVDCACNLRNSSSTGVTYMRVNNSAGTGTWIQSSNWITVEGDDYGGGYSTGLFRATATGNVTFQGYWHVSNFTGYYVYCNLTAYVIGKYQ